jgi:hypothetical protein
LRNRLLDKPLRLRRTTIRQPKSEGRAKGLGSRFRLMHVLLAY